VPDAGSGFPGSLEELDQTGEVIQQFGGHGRPVDQSGRDGMGQRGLGIAADISDIDLSRGTLVESMDEIVELEAVELATLPSLEGFGEWNQGWVRLGFMSPRGPFA
jgi:hypothetical protein